MKVAGPLAWRDEPNLKGPVAAVVFNFAVDSQQRTPTSGAYQGRTLIPKIASVDNTLNPNAITLTLGGVATVIPATQRFNIPIPADTLFLDVASAAANGTTTVTFYANALDAPTTLQLTDIIDRLTRQLGIVSRVLIATGDDDTTNLHAWGSPVVTAPAVLGKFSFLAISLPIAAPNYIFVDEVVWWTPTPQTVRFFIQGGVNALSVSMGGPTLGHGFSRNCALSVDIDPGISFGDIRIGSFAALFARPLDSDIALAANTPLHYKPSRPNRIDVVSLQSLGGQPQEDVGFGIQCETANTALSACFSYREYPLTFPN